jgi:hypothetical protein
MKPIMNINELNTIEQLEQFLSGSQAVAFLVASCKDECYREPLPMINVSDKQLNIVHDRK